MDFSVPNKYIINPFSGQHRISLVQKTIVVLILLGSFRAIFSPSYLEFLTAMSLFLYLSYYFLQSVFTVGIYIALVYQWVQVCLKVIYGALTGVSLESLTKYPENITSAFYLSVFTLFFLALGMQQRLKRIQFSWQAISNSLDQYNTKKYFIFYILFNVFSAFLFSFRFSIPGLFQAIAILSYFRWTLFIILFLLVHKKQQLVLPFWVLVFFEFSASFFSFFAGFKAIIIYLFIGYLSLNIISKRKLILLGLYSYLAYIFALIWTDIKQDYREFLNQGTRTQAIVVSKDDARGYLINTISTYDFSRMKEAQKDLIDRISYIDFFSAAQSYVPLQIPHENGNVLRQSIMHILMPRIFFPSKPIVEDSKHLTKYTGIYFPSFAEGASFSLGYAGDFYIDFGPIWMFIGVFLFGYIIGAILLSIHNTSLNVLWSFGALTASFDLLYKFENSQIKFLGNLIWFWIIFILLNKIVIPRLDYLLKEKE